MRVEGKSNEDQVQGSIGVIVMSMNDKYKRPQVTCIG